MLTNSKWHGVTTDCLFFSFVSKSRNEDTCIYTQKLSLIVWYNNNSVVFYLLNITQLERMTNVRYVVVKKCCWINRDKKLIFGIKWMVFMLEFNKTAMVKSAGGNSTITQWIWPSICVSFFYKNCSIVLQPKMGGIYKSILLFFEIKLCNYLMNG